MSTEQPSAASTPATAPAPAKTRLERVFTPEEITEQRKEREQDLLKQVNNPDVSSLSTLPRVCEHRDGWEIIVTALDTIASRYPPDVEIRRMTLPDRVKQTRLLRALLRPEASEVGLQESYRAHIPDRLIMRYAQVLDAEDAGLHGIVMFADFLASRPKAAQPALPILKRHYQRNHGSDENKALEKAIAAIQESVR